MKKPYTIEVEESKVETVLELIRQINNPPKEETVKVKLYNQNSWDDRDSSYLELTEEQYKLLDWLSQNNWLSDELGIEINPTFEFETI